MFFNVIFGKMTQVSLFGSHWRQTPDAESLSESMFDGLVSSGECGVQELCHTTALLPCRTAERALKGFHSMRKEFLGRYMHTLIGTQWETGLHQPIKTKSTRERIKMVKRYRFRRRGSNSDCRLWTSELSMGLRAYEPRATPRAGHARRGCRLPCLRVCPISVMATGCR